MPSMTVELRNIEGTEAALGCAGGHTLVVDRPEGKAGGRGLGFNGGQLLALAIGGCFCNDLRYAAHELGVSLGAIAVTVDLELEGVPLIATTATMNVDCEAEGGADLATVIARAKEMSTVANSLRRGIKIDIA
jgi:organic hydroperoxide reductase OsmC/OhrA